MTSVRSAARDRLLSISHATSHVVSAIRAMPSRQYIRIAGRPLRPAATGGAARRHSRYREVDAGSKPARDGALAIDRTLYVSHDQKSPTLQIARAEFAVFHGLSFCRVRMERDAMYHGICRRVHASYGRSPSTHLKRRTT